MYEHNNDYSYTYINHKKNENLKLPSSLKTGIRANFFSYSLQTLEFTLAFLPSSCPALDFTLVFWNQALVGIISKCVGGRPHG